MSVTQVNPQKYFLDKHYCLVHPCLDLARVQAARLPALQGEPLAVQMQLAVVQNRLKTVNVFLNNDSLKSL